MKLWKLKNTFLWFIRFSKAEQHLGQLNIHHETWNSSRILELKIQSESVCDPVKSAKTGNKCKTFKRPLSCCQCGKTFATKTQLDCHERIHTNDKPLSCSKCDKKFPLPHDLKEHERTNVAEPFRCLQCDRRFSLFDELKHHKKSHAGEEPFNCTKCDKKFAIGSDLKEQERTHTDE